LALAHKESIIMAPTKTLAALAVLSSLIAGCAQTTPELAAKHNPTVYSVHQPIVQRTNYVLDVGTTGSGLSSGEADRLGGWFESLRLGYGDRISIDSGSAYPDRGTRADVARIAADYGLLLSDGSPVTVGAIQPGAVRVIVSRMSASVPGCPDWAYEALSGAAISTDTNYGCAMNTNLAAMVADPNDLVLGQAGASASNADTATKAIKSYREAPPTGAKGLTAEQPGGQSGGKQ
jgi:pilus assembly protein CpaD